MRNKDEANILRIIMREQGFIKRRNAFFRVWGDGVFQVVKMENEHVTNQPILMLGLHSMYSQLRPQWFTAQFCVTKYPVVLYNHQRFELQIQASSKGNSVIGVVPLKKQLDILNDIAMGRLNKVLDQQTLLDEIETLEMIDSGKIRWNSLDKYAIFLKLGRFEMAARIIESVIEQHEVANSTKRAWMERNGFDYKCSKYELDEANRLEDLLAIAREQQVERVAQFLRENSRVNYEYAKSYVKWSV